MKVSDMNQGNITDNNRVFYRLPLITSIIYVPFIFLLCLIIPRWSHIICFIVGVVFIILFRVTDKFNSKSTIEKLFVLTFSIGAFLMVFAFNIETVSLQIESGFWLEFYCNLHGVFYAMYQIIAVITILLFVFLIYFDIISIKVNIISAFITGVLGFVATICSEFHMYGNILVGILYAFCTFAFFVIGLAFQIEKLKRVK